MTMTDTPLSAEEADRLARQLWDETGGRITGRELGDACGRSERWGRQWIARRRKSDGGNDGSGTGSTAAPPPAAAPVPEPPARRVNGTAVCTPAAAGDGSRKRQPAARRRQSGGTAPLPLVVLTVTAVGTVAAVCAVVSWCHIRDLAAAAGMGALAEWLPLGVDGLAVACTCSLIADRRQDRAAHPLAIAGLVLGIGGSLVANVLAVDPELMPERAVRWILAGYPPLALAVSAHLLFRMLGEKR